ncbi:GAF and ANTAR domain-containing protein [Nocardia asteroides]|uniref:GAF and ANTAR domain-containing protein n=1 Tax=Nocardia asteroides TaxID=1824 RepID=UPI001E37A4FC|nr:GAF and ANTAR domain-containing protein [Nocardia asteroides]UGT63832.1 GAF and ANTAR domain-containing protein [Nocardia asteroides]
MEETWREEPAEPRSGPTGSGGEELWRGIGTVCASAVRLTGTDGAAVAVLSAASQARELVYATDALAQQIDELQFTVGEGPCVEAYHHDRRELWPDLSAGAAGARWPAFSADALALGVRAVFAFPVPGAQGAVGVLELYRSTTGALSADEQESAGACADVVGAALRGEWERRIRAAGGVQGAVEAAVARGAGVADGYSRTVVFNAAGMVAVQLAVSPDEALARLRAYAYANGRSISEVAADIVARTLNMRDQRDSDGGQ